MKKTIPYAMAALLLILLLGIQPFHTGQAQPRPIPAGFPGDRGAWEAVLGLDGRVHALLQVGNDLYVGGRFSNAGGIPNADRIARWDGAQWHALGSGFANQESNQAVNTIFFDGVHLYVGGNFRNIGGDPNADSLARWDGSQWHGVGSNGLTYYPGSVDAIAKIGDNLYIGGSIYNVDDIPEADHIARWDGSQWHAVGGGLPAVVTSFAIMDTDLIVGGYFQNAGGDASADHIARWDGTQWHALGSGMDGSVWAMAVDEDNLYAGGKFSSASGVPGTDKIALWDGTAWQALDAGTPNNVYDIAVSPRGVYVASGMDFRAAGRDVPSGWVRFWDGAQWETLLELNQPGRAVEIVEGTVFAGGYFTDAGDDPDADYLMRFYPFALFLPLATK